MAELKDSGNRREFDTGAVRDMAEGKGRMDLVPWDVVEALWDESYMNGLAERFSQKDSDEWYLYKLIYHVFNLIHLFQENGDTTTLISAADLYIYYWKGTSTMAFGNAILEVGVHFEDGARKYGDNNWRKGIPVNIYIDSAMRHFMKVLRDDDDEPHERAVLWNFVCAIWTCLHKPELNVYRSKNTDLDNTAKATMWAQPADNGEPTVGGRIPTLRKTDITVDMNDIQKSVFGATDIVTGREALGGGGGFDNYTRD